MGDYLRDDFVYNIVVRDGLKIIESIPIMFLRNKGNKGSVEIPWYIPSTLRLQNYLEEVIF